MDFGGVKPIVFGRAERRDALEFVFNEEPKYQGVAALRPPERDMAPLILG